MKQALRMAALSAGLSLAAAPASATTLSFDELAVGSTLSTQYASLGAVFTANAFSGAGTSSSGEAWAGNTDMSIVASAGADVGDLGAPAGLVSGHLLRSYGRWLEEDGDPSFAITFAGEATGFSAAFAGVSTGSDVTLYAYLGSTLVGTVAGSGSGQFVLSFAGPVTRVAVRPGSFDDWVGVDNINYSLTPIPEPGTVAMMSFGLGWLVWRQRQRRGR